MQKWTDKTCQEKKKQERKIAKDIRDTGKEICAFYIKQEPKALICHTFWVLNNLQTLREKMDGKRNECRTKEVRNSGVTKSSYETELRKMTSHFELLTRKFL